MTATTPPEARAELLARMAKAMAPSTFDPFDPACHGSVPNQEDAKRMWIRKAEAAYATLAAAPVHPNAQTDGEGLREALRLALSYLVHNEPGDSRAVSDEFVAMAAIEAGLANAECFDIVRKALATLPPQGQPKPVEAGEDVCANCKGARDDLARGRDPQELCDPCYEDALSNLAQPPATPATTEAGGLHWIDALPYQATFNAIGDALNLPKGSTVGISVEAFQNSLRAALAGSPL